MALTAANAGAARPRLCRRVERIRALLHSLPNDETALFQDEVFTSTLRSAPVGCGEVNRRKSSRLVTTRSRMWLAHSTGEQGTLLVSEPSTRRNSELFTGHLKYLRRKLRSFRLIQVVCDNVAFHRSQAVLDYLNPLASSPETALPPALRAGDPSDRTGLVALPRHNYQEPPLQLARPTAPTSLPLVRPPTRLPPRNEKHLPGRRLAIW